MLLGPEDPVDLVVRAIDGPTGKPVGGVPLVFRVCRGAKEIAAGPGASDASGVAMASFPPATKWEEPRQGAVDVKCRVSLDGSSGLILGSPWRDPRGDARHAEIDLLVVERGTEFLLVCLDGIFEEGSANEADKPWLHMPPQDFLGNVRSESRLHDRTMYVVTGKASSAQRLKSWLMASGFPAGLLLLGDRGSPQESWLRELSSRLESLGARAGRIVCGPEEKAALQGVFPSASVEVVAPQFGR
jgi:hypothetical protein